MSTLSKASFSKHTNNLKVLRRRDPTITSIIDQFSHVCVYHHDGERWEKHGYEGTMFLFERESYPPYGLYILNRVGMGDYVQRLYPEDSIQAHAQYLMMRHYAPYTAARLAKIPPDLDKFSSQYALKEQLTDEEKGPGDTVSLWCFDDGGERPMVETLLKLHSFVKANKPYPAEFHAEYATNAISPIPSRMIAAAPPSSPSLDALFAKLQKPAATTANASLHVAPSASTHSNTPSLLQSIFASVSGAPPTSPAANCVPLPPPVDAPQAASSAKARKKPEASSPPKQHPSENNNSLLSKLFGGLSSSESFALPASQTLASPPILPTAHPLSNEPSLGFSLEGISSKSSPPATDPQPATPLQSRRSTKRERTRHPLKATSNADGSPTSPPLHQIETPLTLERQSAPVFASTVSLWNGPRSPLAGEEHSEDEDEVVELDFSQIAALSAIGANRSTSNSKKQPQIQHQSTTDSHLQQALPHSLNGQSKPVSVLPKPPISQPASQTKPTPVKSRPMPEPESPTRMIPPQVRTSLPTATRVLASVSPPPITPKPAHSLPNGNGNHHQQAPETPEKDKSPRKKKGKAAKEPQKPSPVVTPPIAPTVSSGISQTNGTQPIQQSLLATLLPRSQNNGSLPRDRKKFGAAVRAMMQDEMFVDQLWNNYWT